MNNQLFDAVHNNNLLNVQELVANGADVNCRDYSDNTPLHLAKLFEIAQFLVLNGADVNCRNDVGNTPLHLANSLEIVQLLVLNDADVNCRNIYGSTPLHHSICHGLKYVKMFLKNGADMHIKNNNHVSAYDHVMGSNNNELIELFELYNAISNGLDIKEPCDE